MLMRVFPKFIRLYIIKLKIHRMGSSHLNTFVDLPNCIRTALRAKILLSLHSMTICTVDEICEIGFKRSTVHRVLKEFTASGLAVQRQRLYKITEMGDELAKALLLDQKLWNWHMRNLVSMGDELILRPKISPVYNSIPRRDNISDEPV